MTKVLRPHITSFYIDQKPISRYFLTTVWCGNFSIKKVITDYSNKRNTKQIVVFTILWSQTAQRDKLTLPPLFFQIFSNCECYLDKDRSSPILIFCLKIFAKKNHQKRLEMKPIQETSVINVLLPEEISLATCCYRKSSSKKCDCYFA